MRLYNIALAIMIIGITACTPAVQTTPSVVDQPTATAGIVETSTPPALASPLPATETPVTPEAHSPTETSIPESSTPSDYRLAYVGTDGNINILPPDGNAVQVTQDGVVWKPGDSSLPNPMIINSSPRWSSDSTLLAFTRETSSEVSSGRSYEYDLLVFDLASSQTRVVIDNQQLTGFAWKPGTHLITFGLPVDFSFFMDGDTTTVQGLFQVDADSKTVSDLVQPERSLPLAHPAWTVDGEKVAFEEIYLMEGAGKFAFYDFSLGKYIAWDEPIGGYSFSPDGSLIAYDNLTYTPTGTEQVLVRSLVDGEDRQISQSVSPNYSFAPLFSPDGTSIAYLASKDGPESQDYDVMVVPSAGGEPRSLGLFWNPSFLIWSPDGSSLIFSRGPYENPELVVVNVTSGAIRVLGAGNQAAVDY